MATNGSHPRGDVYRSSRSTLLGPEPLSVVSRDQVLALGVRQAARDSGIRRLEVLEEPSQVRRDDARNGER